MNDIPLNIYRLTLDDKTRHLYINICFWLSLLIVTITKSRILLININFRRLLSYLQNFGMFA